MCSGLGVNNECFYFGRNLDVEISYGEKVIITPRKKEIILRNGKVLNYHFAIIGMGTSADGYPLYFDAVNEAGLSGAALKFNDAHYREESDEKTNIASFELLLYILSSFENIFEVKTELTRINMWDIPFSASLPASPLHWIFADKTGALTVESTKDGLMVYENDLCVLTNMPRFEIQRFNLNNYMHLSAHMPKNKFLKNVNLVPYSLGMGVLGLPGDFSSMSRFVKLNFVKDNILKGKNEFECIEQFFHALDTVSQPLGCTITENGDMEYTLYSNCYNADSGICYYKTYFNSEIISVKLENEDLNARELKEYELKKRDGFCEGN